MGEYYDHVVCCGGDGTLSETITGLYSHKQGGMSLGYIPAGTTNDFSRSLELPADDPLLAAEYSVAGYRQACDVGRVNGRRLFIYVAAFGAFTQTSYATPQPMKNVLGGTAYVLAGISSLTSISVFRISHNERTEPRSAYPICNNAVCRIFVFYIRRSKYLTTLLS